MSYVKTIKLEPGEFLSNSIDTFLKLSEAGMTRRDTCIDLNGVEYPIGLFGKDNIDLFKLGLTTMQNMQVILGQGASQERDVFKEQARTFADKIIEGFADDPYTAEAVLEKFDTIMSTITREDPNKPGIPMFNQEEKDRIKTILDEKKKSTLSM